MKTRQHLSPGPALPPSWPGHSRWTEALWHKASVQENRGPLFKAARDSSCRLLRELPLDD